MSPRPRAVVVGASAGGMEALALVLGALEADFPLPVLVVQHISPAAATAIPELLDERCRIRVKEADEKETPRPGTAYLAPPNYHLLVERDATLSLSTEGRVCFARPSVDVLFETAALAFGPALVGVVLTGGNEDGSRGLAAIARAGGRTIVQAPATAVAPEMPRAALAATRADHVLPPEDIGPLLSRMAQDDD
ncbi:chemotaxis protein CheB [Desulfocurvus sp.]|uniref:chemotaxis protein CheB n=1 Tax=Desulfocurvus sp. TaxID=2871698 RepID=UPI0025B8C08F|nr:chemotaxis protein CheB [Desulfocurvus sp.]MCK9238779.1 chemotaxis protein CheB [Desulfocurvus sp.]